MVEEALHAQRARVRDAEARGREKWVADKWRRSSAAWFLPTEVPPVCADCGARPAIASLQRAFDSICTRPVCSDCWDWHTDREKDPADPTVALERQLKQGRACAGCGRVGGQTVAFNALQWDHRDDQLKRGNIGCALRVCAENPDDHQLRADLDAEVAACDLMCRACHKQHTKERIFDKRSDVYSVGRRSILRFHKYPYKYPVKQPTDLPCAHCTTGRPAFRLLRPSIVFAAIQTQQCPPELTDAHWYPACLTCVRRDARAQLAPFSGAALDSLHAQAEALCPPRKRKTPPV
jgi:hypothetical protein